MADGGTTGGGAQRFTIVQPTGWARPRGYSNGIRVPAGHDLLFVAGQVGWDEQERLVSGGLAGQFEQALRNCVSVVEAAGGRAEHIVRLTMFCRDKGAYLASRNEIGEGYRRVLGRHYPAMSLVQVADLVEAGALIEIEATAALPSRGARAGAG